MQDSILRILIDKILELRISTLLQKGSIETAKSHIQLEQKCISKFYAQFVFILLFIHLVRNR